MWRKVAGLKTARASVPGGARGGTGCLKDHLAVDQNLSVFLGCSRCFIVLFDVF